MPQKKLIILFCFLTAVLVFGCRRKPQSSSEIEVINTAGGMQMIRVPAGWFVMGSDDGSADEQPAHRVWVDSFLMDRFEVTQKQFRRLEISDPSHFKDPNNPVENISWLEAAVFCNERSLAEGLEPCYNLQTRQCNFDANGYRLPTEAEWEYACRAGTKSKYFFGSDGDNLSEYAWFAENSNERTHPVGQKKPNPWGLYDMYGNVSEWCNDFYSADYYNQSPEKNPKGPVEGNEKVLRGGAWNLSVRSCYSARRAGDICLDDTCLASDAVGFRCVRNISGEDLEAQIMQTRNELEQSTKTGIVYGDIYLKHLTTPGHPESPQRLTTIIERLKQDGLYSKLVEIKPSPADLRWIEQVHATEYIQRAKESCEQNMTTLDSPDVPISQNSYEVALNAAGGVLNAVDAVMAGDIKNAFCAVRPPGHHALKDKAMGFCIFNNIAIAAKYIQEKYNLNRVLIVDWDVHHGNGTQAAFYDDPSVLYFSVHQSPFYPLTGEQTERGAGAGLNYTINVPIPAGANDADYKKAFNDILYPAALAFDPDFVLISAGFDSQGGDTIGGMDMTAEGFGELTKIVKKIASRCCRGRLVSVLEGGYNLENLADAAEEHIKVLMDSGD